MTDLRFSDYVMELRKVAYQLGIMPDAFYRMIPREFYEYAVARIEYLRDVQEAEARRFAQVCTTIANFSANRTKTSRVFKIEDFLPKKKQTQKDMLSEVERMNKLFSGSEAHKKVVSD
jgi:hypothetical protein